MFAEAGLNPEEQMPKAFFVQPVNLAGATDVVAFLASPEEGNKTILPEWLFP